MSGLSDTILVAFNVIPSQVGYTPGVLTAATADMTVTLLLATSRRLLEGGASKRSLLKYYQ